MSDMTSSTDSIESTTITSQELSSTSDSFETTESTEKTSSTFESISTSLDELTSSPEVESTNPTTTISEETSQTDYYPTTTPDGNTRKKVRIVIGILNWGDAANPWEGKDKSKINFK